MDQTGDRPRERSQDEMTGVMTDCAQEMAVQAHFSAFPSVVAVYDTAIECVAQPAQLVDAAQGQQGLHRHAAGRRRRSLSVLHPVDALTLADQVFSDSVVHRRPVDEHRIAIWIGDILSALEYMIQDDCAAPPIMGCS